MNSDEAKNILRDISRFGDILLTRHCKKRMQQRNIFMDDILNVLMWGSVENIIHVEDDRWECTVNGHDLEEDELTCIVNFFEETKALCITVY